MSYRIERTLDLGDEKRDYVFQLQPVSIRAVLNYSGGSPGAVLAATEQAIKYVECNGERLEDPLEAPNELLVEVMQHHPSFRGPDTARSGQ